MCQKDKRKGWRRKGIEEVGSSCVIKWGTERGHNSCFTRVQERKVKGQEKELGTSPIHIGFKNAHAACAKSLEQQRAGLQAKAGES